ncbi:MAG: ABC transporter permease [Lagierella massiliensis]|nr:ABC transporter permease [Lagierella massiliensis]
MFSFNKFFKNKIWGYLCLFFAIISIIYAVNQKQSSIKSITVLDKTLEQLPYHLTNLKASKNKLKDNNLKEEITLYNEKATSFYYIVQEAYGNTFSFDDSSYYANMDKAYDVFIELQTMEDSFIDKLDQNLYNRYFTDKENQIVNFLNVYKYHKDNNIEISPTRETFLGLFESTWKLLFSSIFIVVMLIFAIFISESRQFNFKVDDGSYKFPQINLLDLAMTTFLPPIIIISCFLGIGVLSVLRRNPFGSFRELLTYDVLLGNSFSLIDPNSNFGIYHNSYILILLQLLLTTTLCFLTMYLIYKLFRKFLNFGISTVLTFSIVSSIIFLQEKFIELELYFSFNQIKILSRNTNLILLIALVAIFSCLNYIFRYRRESKFNLNKYYNSKNIKNLKSFEIVKIKRSPFINIFFVTIVILSLLIPFSFNESPEKIKNDAITNLDVLIKFQKNFLEEFKGIDRDNMLNNPEQTISLLEDIQKTYPKKDKNPKAYLKSLLKYNIQGDAVLIGDEDNYNTNQNYVVDRIKYFLDNDLKPDDELNITGVYDNLFVLKKPSSLYLNNMYFRNFEDSGAMGQFVKAHDIGFIPLITFLICSIISFKTCEDLKKSKTVLLLSSGKSKSKIFLTKFLSALVLSIISIIIVYILIFGIGFIKDGLGEPKYPLITYASLSSDVKYIGGNIAVINILPKVILSTILYAVTLISFIFMIFSTGFKGSSVITIICIVLGMSIANMGLLGKLSVINPFNYFDSMLFVNGGISFVNNTPTINFVTGCLVMIIESIIFISIGNVILNRRYL